MEDIRWRVGEETRLSRYRKKEAAFNPAVVIDDVFDAYIQYNAAKRQIEAENARKRPVAKQPIVKQAGAIADYLQPIFLNAMENPSVMIPSAKTVATVGSIVGAGVGASMYGPEWVYGPTKEQVEQGNRFNAKRALKATAATATIGTSILSMPSNAVRSALADNASEALMYAAKAVPGIAATAVIGNAYHKGTNPDMANVRKAYTKANVLGVGLSIGGALADPNIQEVINQATQRS